MSHPENKDQFVPTPPASSEPHVATHTPTPAMPTATGATAPPETTTSGMAIAGLVCAFLAPLLGVIFSIIGLNQTKDNKRGGRGLAVAGLIISIIRVLVDSFVIVLFIIAAATADPVNNDYDFSSSGSSSLSSLNSDDTKVVGGKVAEAVTVEDVQLIVKEVKRGYIAESEYYKPDTGKEYIAVTVDLKNNGSESKTFSSFSFKVRDSAGLELNDAYVGTVAGELESGSLSAGGGTTSGIIVFEVPQSDTGLTLIYEPSYFGSEVAEIKL